MPITSFNVKEPEIDPAFCDQLNTLPVLDDALYAANYHYQEAHSPEERAAHCDEFDAAAQELLMVYLAVMQHGQRMREGIAPVCAGRVIPLRRRQPRDARGRFVKRLSD